jgi:hypothetical protein
MKPVLFKAQRVMGEKWEKQICLLLLLHFSPAAYQTHCNLAILFPSTPHQQQSRRIQDAFELLNLEQWFRDLLFPLRESFNSKNMQLLLKISFQIL